jgi:hypothetical protein
LTTDPNHNRLSQVIKGNGYPKLQIKERIAEATSELNKHYFIMMTERISSNNAEILARFIISSKKDRNISRNTVISYIDGIVYLENYHQHKNLEKMDKKDIISFLDSYRKSEAADPLHRWINTYNIRLQTLFKFFRWLYNLKYNESKTVSIPPIMNGIRDLKEKKRAHIKQKIYGLTKMI